MIKAMLRHVEARRWDLAAAIAKDAAPYIHPRLAAIQHTGQDGGAITIDVTVRERIASRLALLADRRGERSDPDELLQ